MLQKEFLYDHSLTTELVPINSATATNFPFPDIPILRDRLIVGISASVVPLTIYTGKLNLNSLVFTASYSAFLTLVDTNGNQFVQNMPTVELNPVGAITVTLAPALTNYARRSTNGMMFFRPRYVAWEKCYVYFPTPPGTANATLQFTIFYLNLNKNIPG